jgi:hypothetical protein
VVESGDGPAEEEAEESTPPLVGAATDGAEAATDGAEAATDGAGPEAAEE